MRKSQWLPVGLFLLSGALSARPASAQKLEATVLYRQNSDSTYAAVIPHADGSKPEGTIDCAADATNEACAQPSQTGTPGKPFLTVSGTTVSLLLPDGRIAVVNCPNKYSFKGNYMNRHSCAMPLVEHVEADFNGRNARLKWIFSSDDKKPEIETYRIVALLDKP